MAVTWTPPKTDWTSEDAFNIRDYNRIKNNLIYLYEKSLIVFPPYDIDDMGEDVTDEKHGWSFRIFNSFETNLEAINRNTLGRDYGEKNTFYGNGPFIRPEELTRIESAMLNLYEKIENLMPMLQRLPLHFGEKSPFR